MKYFVLALMVVTALGCRGRKQGVVPAKSVQLATACNTQRAIDTLKAKHPGFLTSVTLSDIIILSKNIVASDGQRIGYEKYSFSYNSDISGNCVFENLTAEREVNGDRLVNNFNKKESQFYRGGQLVYVDLALRDGWWWRKYNALAFVPVRVPNWATRSGDSLYMTWVARSATTASRVPVWGFEAIWQKDGRDYTLMAGNAIFRNPESGNPTKDDVVTTLRLDEKGLVNKACVLFPVSQKTWEKYFDYLRGKGQSWERSRLDDEAVLVTFLKGPVKNTRARRTSVADVCAKRGVVSTELPEVKGSFQPAFDILPQW